MEEPAHHLPTRRHPTQGTQGTGHARRSRALRGAPLALCAAVLAVALAAGIRSAAVARSAAASAAVSLATSPPSATASAAAPAPAVSAGAASGPVDAELDAEISSIIDAHGEYQFGVALLDLSGGTVHEYVVREPFVAASTAKVLAAEA